VKVDLSNGLIDGVRFVASPNCDDRPDKILTTLIVIHGISLPPRQYGGPWIDALFTNTLPTDQHPYFAEISHLKVSSHLLIRRDGEIVQYVPFYKRAWHAGISCYADEENCNNFSIGIELEGSDDEPYEEIQYQQLSKTINALIDAYPSLSRERVAGHSDIAPGRKTDPGEAFDWSKLEHWLSMETNNTDHQKG
jgi:AmpD protein